MKTKVYKHHEKISTLSDQNFENEISSISKKQISLSVWGIKQLVKTFPYIHHKNLLIYISLWYEHLFIHTVYDMKKKYPEKNKQVVDET